MELNPQKDAVITLRDGRITGVYAPDGIRVIIIDFDSIEAGKRIDMVTANWNEGNVSTPDARDAIQNAMNQMK